MLPIAFAINISNSFAQHQNKKFDSLSKQLLIVSDSEKIAILYTLSNASYDQSNEQARRCAEQGLKFTQEHGYKKDEVRFLHTLGNIYSNDGNYSKSLEFYLKEIKAIETYGMPALAMSSAYLGMGNVCASQYNLDKALEYYNKGLEIVKGIGDKYSTRLIPFYLNIGGIYSEQKKYNEALSCFFYVITIFEAGKAAEPLYDYGNAYNNIGEVYFAQENYDKALDYFNMALRNYIGIKMELRIAMEYNNIGNVFLAKKQYEKSIAYYEKAIGIMNTIPSNEILMQSYFGMARAYSGKNDFKNGYAYYSKYSDTKDSVLNQESQKQMNELQTKYESETKDKELIKKDAEIQKKQMEGDLARTESNRQRIAIFLVLAVALAVVIIAIIIFRSLKIARHQKMLIEKQKIVVEEKQKEILDSIHYAQRIQKALLAADHVLNENLSDYFLLYKPKDIVSGDFYWATKLNNDNFVLVTADSTGHGVPGAIMSILNISCLDKAITKGIQSPDLILNEARNLIINHLHNDGSADGGKDGMDGSIMRFDFKNKTLYCACANIPIWIVRNNKLIEIKPDRMPIGKHEKDNIPFTLQTMELQKGDVVYSFTDGYADQFGGPSGKKFKYKQLQELLLKENGKSMEIQKQILSDAFDNWKGSVDQIDDVCLFGIRV